jgi:hypothetical protein
MLLRSRENNKIKPVFYAPVRCRVTIKYAISFTKFSSSFAFEAYFVAVGHEFLKIFARSCNITKKYNHNIQPQG